MYAISDTFVLIAPDCATEHSIIPTTKPGAKPSVHTIQYDLLTEYPYRYSLEELIYQVHIRHKEIPADRLRDDAEGVRAELFSKNHPCMRASMLPKKYGWGVHYNHEGKLALHAMESEEYSQFADGADGVQLVYAMRTKRA